MKDLNTFDDYEVGYNIPANPECQRMTFKPLFGAGFRRT